MSKKIIVTGITGQDGSYMVDYLLNFDKTFEIYGVVRRSANPNYSNVAEHLANPRFKIVYGDLSDSHSIDTLVQSVCPDYFINFAAQSFVGASWKLPEQTFDITAVGTLRCLESVRRHAPNCRFYNAGSSEQFGNVIYSPQDETHPFRPRSPYAAAKCAAHMLIKVYRESYNLYAVQGLLFNHESPRRGEEFVTRKITKGIATILDSVKRYKPIIPIELGNVNSKRDWSHARDFVDGIWKMLHQEGEPKDYVLSSDETHTIREFVEEAFAAAGFKGFWAGSGSEETFCDKVGGIHIPLVKINPEFYRPAEVDILLGNSDKARRELGWEPIWDFKDLVRAMVESDIKKFCL